MKDRNFHFDIDKRWNFKFNASDWEYSHDDRLIFNSETGPFTILSQANRSQSLAGYDFNSGR